MLRLIRLSKLTRYLRILKKAAWLDVLRLILKSIYGSQTTVIWSMILLFMVQSLTSLFLGQVLMEYMTNQKIPLPERRAIYLHWGTFWRCVCTIFEITFVNANTAGIRVLMDNIDIGWSSFFMMYRVLINFVLLSVVKAVIVKQIFKVADSDAELLMQQTLRADSQHRSRMRRVFDLMDCSHDGKISREELEAFIQNDEVKLVLRSLDLKLAVLDVNDLFDMLDTDGSGCVSFDEVLEGFAKAQGSAKGIDMQHALIKIDHIKKELLHLTRQVQRCLPQPAL